MIKVIGEITAATFEQYLEECDIDGFQVVKIEQDLGVRTAPGRVIISSLGGEIGYVLAMLDEIDEKKRMTYATGICQSAAAVLATAGEGKRVCTMDTLFRFIPPATEKLVDPQTGETVDKVPDLRYYLHSICVARLAQRLKWAIPETNDLFNGEFISSTRAKELGLVDEVISTEASNGNSDRLSKSEGSTDIFEQSECVRKLREDGYL